MGPEKRRGMWFAGASVRVLLYAALLTILSAALLKGGFSSELPLQETLRSPAAQTPHAKEEAGSAGHSDPFSFILLELFLIVAVAMIGRWLALKFNQAPVLGELLFGVILGNIGYWAEAPMFLVIMQLGNLTPLFAEIWTQNLTVAEAARAVFSEAEMAPNGPGAQLIRILTGKSADSLVMMALALWLFSNLGVILLLFMVGLGTRVDEMMKVGARALLVAIVGVAAPFASGFLASYWLLPEVGLPAHLFLGATLCATSVGITARVFRDLNRIHTPEAKIILGAAVIDDILGLIILAVVSGIVVTGALQFFEVLRISAFSIAFIGAVVLFGDRFVRLCIPVVTRLDRHHSKLLFPLTLCFALAWLASQIELATIVGAFAAGLILNEEHFQRHSDVTKTIEELIAPLETIFAPIFFVLMGMQVNLASFLEPTTLVLALAFTATAIAGKIVAGLPASRKVDRLTVGFGMIPRGEVGLIFASIGKGLGVVTDGVFSAVVIMVIVTTLITPALLKWSLFRNGDPDAA